MSVLLVTFRRLQLLLSICNVKRESKQQVKTELKKVQVINPQQPEGFLSWFLRTGTRRVFPGTYNPNGTCTYLLELSQEGPLEKRLLCLLLHRQLHKLSAALRFDAHAGKTAFADAAEDDVQRARKQAGVCLWT